MAHVLANDLRAAVLQAALEGKLTSRCKSDSDISESIHLIKCDIERKLKKKEIKKLPSYEQIAKDEWDRIPQGWRAVKLGQISYFISKGTTPRGGNVSYCEGGVGFLRAENIAGYDKLNLQNLKYISQETNDTFLQRSILKEHDILITIAGTLGRTGLVKKEDLPLNTNQAVSIVRTYPEYLDLRYIVMAINAPSIQKSFLDLTRTTAIPNLTLEIISNILIPLPPIEEQARIVAKVDEIMAKIDEYEKSEKKLEKLEKEFPEDMKASLLQAAMQGKLTKQMKEDGNADDLLKVISEERAKLVKEKKIKKSKPLPQISEDEIPFDIPDNWRWVRFGNILNIVSAKRVHKSDWQKSGIPFYRAREIAKLAKDNQVDNDLFISEELFDELSKYGIPEPNDLMVTGVGTLGKTYIVKSNDKFYYKDASVLCMKNYGHISSDYIKSVMESPYMQKEIKKSSSGTTVGTLTIIRLSNYLFPLPPLAEQHRIVKKLDELLPLCETLKED